MIDNINNKESNLFPRFLISVFEADVESSLNKKKNSVNVIIEAIKSINDSIDIY